MKINVAVFFGCRSVEHEVSIISAVQAMQSMDREKYEILPVYVTKEGEMVTGEALFEIRNYRDLSALGKSVKPVVFVRENNRVYMKYQKNPFAKKAVPVDVAFPIVHGTNCEDGTIQGLFEFLNLPYVGCDGTASAIGMDKALFKDVMKRFSLPVLDCVTFFADEYLNDAGAVIDRLIREIGFPMIIKPINLGSSVGITKVKTEEELRDAIDLAVSFADRILAEHAVENLREINCSVLGNARECTASVCEEPFASDSEEILSYEDKYLSQGSKKTGTGAAKGMASLSRKVPADLSEEQSRQIRDLSCQIFRAMDACGVVRIDYILDQDTGTVYANEVNTIPGSLAFYLWKATGMPYRELLDRMISLAFERSREREKLTFTIPTNILSGVSLGGAKGSKGSKLS